MNIHWLYLFGSLALLLPPIPFSANFQRSLLSLRRGKFATAKAAAKVWQNWVDFARAALGVYLLTQHAIVPDANKPAEELQLIAVKAGILGLVLLAQTVRVFR